jgi:hypothetical protein
LFRQQMDTAAYKQVSCYLSKRYSLLNQLDHTVHPKFPHDLEKVRATGTGRGIVPKPFARFHAGFRTDGGKVAQIWRQGGASDTMDVLIRVAPVLGALNAFVRAHAPARHAQMCAVPAQFRLSGTCFTSLAVNHGHTDLHRDWGDLGCAIMYFGAPRWVYYPEAGVRVFVRGGDMSTFPSGLCWHGSELLDGVSHCVVAYSSAALTRAENLQPQCEPFSFLACAYASWRKKAESCARQLSLST